MSPRKCPFLPDPRRTNPGHDGTTKETHLARRGTKESKRFRPPFASQLPGTDCSLSLGRAVSLSLSLSIPSTPIAEAAYLLRMQCRPVHWLADIGSFSKRPRLMKPGG